MYSLSKTKNYVKTELLGATFQPSQRKIHLKLLAPQAEKFIFLELMLWQTNSSIISTSFHILTWSISIFLYHYLNIFSLYFLIINLF